MSKSKPGKKKVVVTTRAQKEGNTTRKPAVPRTKSTTSASTAPLTFGRETYIWMGIGVALIFVGLLLMSGGEMPSPEVWEPERIYGFRRTVLAPILILGGLGMQVFVIFRK